MLDRLKNTESITRQRKSSLLHVLAAILALHTPQTKAGERGVLEKAPHTWEAVTTDFARMSEKATPEMLLELSKETFQTHLHEHPNAFESDDPGNLQQVLSLMSAVSSESVAGTRYDFKGLPPGAYVFSSKEGGHGNGVVLQFNEDRKSVV